MCKVGRPSRNLHAPIARLAPRECQRVLQRLFLREVRS
jgi:hypothetical protein